MDEHHTRGTAINFVFWRIYPLYVSLFISYIRIIIISCIYLRYLHVLTLGFLRVLVRLLQSHCTSGQLGSSVVPPKNGEIALWLPTNSLMYNRYVSQKRDESFDNDKCTICFSILYCNSLALYIRLKYILLSNLSNCQLTTCQYWKVDNRQVRGVWSAIFSFMGGSFFFSFFVLFCRHTTSSPIDWFWLWGWLINKGAI